MKDIFVIGGGGHAKVIISILKRNNKFNIVGYIDVENKGQILGVKYAGKDEDVLEEYKNAAGNCIMGIGQIKSSLLRRSIVAKYNSAGFNFPSAIAPGAIINEDVLIDEGTVIMDGAVINSGVRIGKHSIVNTKSSVDHDCVIGDFTHIAPGVTMSGSIVIGNDVLIGTGASIIQDIKITDGIIIGAGSVVLGSITEPGVYGGNPARKIK